MEVGKLYTYPNSRTLYNHDSHPATELGTLKMNEHFMLLELGRNSKWTCTFKILTGSGLIGWVEIGYPEKVTPLETNT